MKYNDLFRSYRLKYMQINMDKVKRESNDVEQKLLHIQRSPRICTNDECRTVYEKLKHKCDICGSKVEKNIVKETRMKDSDYFAKDSIDVGHTLKKKSFMKVGEPILDNPNSYFSINRILAESKANHSIEEKRQWVFLGCDGALYCLANRIID